jgi:2-methylcitrate dehydratase PrpD
LRNEKRVSAEALRRLDVSVYPAAYDLLNGVQPTSAYAAKFCLPFTVAAALNRGRVGLNEFENLNASDIRATMARVHMTRDESLAAEYPEKWPARLTATLESGESMSAWVEYPKGDSKNPMTLNELQDKFRGLTEGILSMTQQNHIIAVVDRLEDELVANLWLSVGRNTRA